MFTDLLEQARAQSKEVKVNLENNLTVRVRAAPDRALLLATASTPTQEQARHVASLLGWVGTTIHVFPLRNAMDALLITPDPSQFPPYLEVVRQAAVEGHLPRGPCQLPSGLVMNLSEYVLAWAVCWPRDQAHVRQRLEECLVYVSK